MATVGVKELTDPVTIHYRPSLAAGRQSTSHRWQLVVVLCDTRDNSILIVDTYVTIPVSLRSRYIAVYRSSKKYRKMAQVSRVSTIPRVSYHWATSNLQAYDAKMNVSHSH